MGNVCGGDCLVLEWREEGFDEAEFLHGISGLASSQRLAQYLELGTHITLDVKRSNGRGLRRRPLALLIWTALSAAGPVHAWGFTSTITRAWIISI